MRFRALHIGIIGLPASGKTLVFQTLTQSDSPGSRAGGKSEMRVVAVPDARLETLAAMYTPRKVTPATIEFVDPQIVGQSGVQYVESLLPLMRDADALVHVVRAFDNPSVPHPAGSVDPARDYRQLNSELLLADLGVVERRVERLSKDLRKMKDPELAGEYAMLLRCQEALENEQSIRQLDFSEDEQKRLRGFGLLSSKAQLVGLNLDENAIENRSRTMCVPRSKNAALR
jgi:ribosome-binding ATPase YchF (GTP1/OBG family)